VQEKRNRGGVGGVGTAGSKIRERRVRFGRRLGRVSQALRCKCQVHRRNLQMLSNRRFPNKAGEMAGPGGPPFSKFYPWVAPTPQQSNTGIAGDPRSTTIVSRKCMRHPNPLSSSDSSGKIRGLSFQSTILQGAFSYGILIYVPEPDTLYSS